MTPASSRSGPGELAIVLHTHMPYVEGFGTWPFGEEWLWEAIATSYVPLLDVLKKAPITLSLTPVLCDQLEDSEAMERCIEFLETVRPESHRLDIERLRDEGRHGLADELERSAADYAAAVETLKTLPSGLLAALGEHASWTSAATHAVLPLLASDTATALQVQTGVAAHRRRFGEWEGGFWLPECGHAPWLNPLLEQAGVRSTCVELTNRFGLGDPRHLKPLATDDGPVLWPVDRQTMSLVWGGSGYPSDGCYRNYHHYTEHRHRVWGINGAPYDRETAADCVARDAADFVSRVHDRVRDGGVCVCALDTELLGHWWYEGVRWLDAVVDECGRQGLALTTLDDALERHEPVPAPATLGVTSWGAGGDLRTWSGPAVAELAWRARSLELKLLAVGGEPSERALRELLALQSSDWAFIATNELAGPYPHERAAGHAEALERALDGGDNGELTLRNLAPDLTGWRG
jgi:1,4-alpha-glucan branching enzyme